ncbi:Uncharacterised protein [Mycobacteroides abscessus]|nr:Uncharacterised protein [Mycobacteroides abscessus]
MTLAAVTSTSPGVLLGAARSQSWSSLANRMPPPPPPGS